MYMGIWQIKQVCLKNILKYKGEFLYIFQGTFVLAFKPFSRCLFSEHLTKTALVSHSGELSTADSMYAFHILICLEKKRLILQKKKKSIL